MSDVNIKQRQVLMLFKSFIGELHHHHFSSLNQFESFYSSYFQENQSFFTQNFLHIFEDNFKASSKHNFAWRKVQTQIAKSVLAVNMSEYNPPSNANSSFGAPAINFSSPTEIFKFLATLINKQNSALRAGLRPSNQLKLPDDLPDKFALLAVLYRAEHILYRKHTPEDRQKVLSELVPYGIDSYETFKKTIDDLSRYFKALARYLKSLKTQKKPIKEVTNSISEMLHRIKNERLGQFFTEYLKNFNSLKIEGGSPTAHQKQTLKYLTEQLINDHGHDHFLSSIFKVLKSTRPLQGINSDRSPKSIIPFEIFIQILENRIKNPSVKFLVVFYFEWIFGHIKNIEDFVFSSSPAFSEKLKFDYKRFLNSLLNQFDPQSFRKLNLALVGLSKQVDALLENQAADLDKFTPIYAKLLFKILSQFYFLVSVPDFLQFANTYMIPREHYPYNFKIALIRSTMNPDQTGKPNAWMADNIEQIEAPSPVKPVSLDSKLDDIIGNLNKYLDIIKNRQYGSEQERAEILRLVRQVLDSEVPQILGKIQIKKPVNLPSPVETFKPAAPVELQAKVTIQGLPEGKVFHITVKLLDRASVITKIFEQLFKYTSKEQNSRLLTLFSTLLHFKIKDPTISQKLDHLYEAIDIYTRELDKLFAADDHELLKDVWKILVLFFSRNCHIKLYKLLSDRIAVINSQLKNEIDTYTKMKVIIRNFIVFLIKNRKMDFKKDCDAVMQVILRTKKINQKIIKKALLLHNFKKILNEFSAPGNQVGVEDQSVNRHTIINRLVKFALKHHDLGKILQPGRKPDYQNEITPPKPVVPPVQESIDPKKVAFVRKVIKSFFQYFKKKNHIRDFGKILYFGVPSKELDSFKTIYSKYQKSPRTSFFEKNKRIYLNLQKMLLKSFSLPPKTPSDRSEKYIEFVKKIIMKTGFHSNTKKSNRDHEMAKILYKPSPSLLKTLHLLYKKYRNAQSFFMDTNNQSYILRLKKILFKKISDGPVSPKTPTFTPSEVTFANKLINLFVKNTPFYEQRAPFKKTQTRIFLKKLPVRRAEFFKRIYRRYPKVTQFLKKGPVTRLQNILAKTLYKRIKAEGCKCSAKCYKIVNGEKIELTDDERKELIGDDFKCAGPGDQGFKWLDGQSEENKPGYGCACGCGGKGTVQLNDHPVFNLTFDFSSDAEAQRFRTALMDPEIVDRIANTNSINLPALKAKYGSSEPGKTFDFALKTNPQKPQSGSLKNPVTTTNPSYKQGGIKLEKSPDYDGPEKVIAKPTRENESDTETDNSDEAIDDFDIFMTKEQESNSEAQNIDDFFDKEDDEEGEGKNNSENQLLASRTESDEESQNPLEHFNKVLLRQHANGGKNQGNQASNLTKKSMGIQASLPNLTNFSQQDQNLFEKIFGEGQQTANQGNPDYRVRHGIQNARDQQENENQALNNFFRRVQSIGETNNARQNGLSYNRSSASYGKVPNTYERYGQGIKPLTLYAPKEAIAKYISRNRVKTLEQESQWRNNQRFLEINPQPLHFEPKIAAKPTEMV